MELQNLFIECNALIKEMPAAAAVLTWSSLEAKPKSNFFFQIVLHMHLRLRAHWGPPTFSIEIDESPTTVPTGICKKSVNLNCEVPLTVLCGELWNAIDHQLSQSLESHFKSSSTVSQPDRVDPIL